jgi:hypothetical protein
MSDFIRQSSSSSHKFDGNDGWVILPPIGVSIKRKIEAIGTPLKQWEISIYRGVLTGFNEAFIIDEETKNELIKASPKNAEIIRPILRGRNIKKYNVVHSEFIILIPFGWTNLNRGNIDPDSFFKESYTAVYEHLLSKSKLTGKGKGLFNRDDKGEYWWELRPCSYLDKFNKEKITYIDIMTDNEEDGYFFPCFSFSTKGEIILNTAYFMTGEPALLKYIIAVLNSKLGKFIVKNYVIQLQQRQYRLFQQNVESFPIPKVPREKWDIFVTYIDQLVTSSPEKIKSTEQHLEKVIFELYKVV